MTLTQMIYLVRRRLGFRRDLDPDIRFELDAQQRELENMPETPWFLKRTLTLQNVELLDVGDVPFDPPQYGQDLVMPEGVEFLNMAEYGGLWYKEVEETNAQWKRLHRREEEAVTDSEFAVGPPCFFDPDEYGVIRIFPVPDKIYDFRLTGYFRDVAPSTLPLPLDSQTNIWMREAHELLAWKTVESLASDLHIKETVELAMLRVREHTVKLNQQKIARMEADRYRTMGEDQ